MYVDVNSVIIDNVNMGQYLLNAKFGYNKLWAENSGRNLRGDITGTLTGIYPKLVLTFKPNISQNELSSLCKIFDKPKQNVQYFDANKNTKITMGTYSGDYEIEYENIGQNKSFNISFISLKRRG